MLTHAQRRAMLHRLIGERMEQGHDVDGLGAELDALPASHDAFDAFEERLAGRPIRSGWPHVEPDDIEDVRDECDPARPLGEVGEIDPGDAVKRVEAAFVGRVCGCMLGKPFEVFVTLEEIESALRSSGEWPLADYPTEEAVRALPHLQAQWTELVRGRIDHVAPDDDINYTVLAMLALERHGAAFTHEDMSQLWLLNLPVAATFGPERTRLVTTAAATLPDHAPPGPMPRPALNPGEELCGALIRADAYGYAALGRPELAAELAHRDASFTHRRTGVYGAMFVAAAIAVAPFSERPLDIFRTALAFVPQRSRFADAVRTCIAEVDRADDWRDGYERVRARYGEYGFCRIYQEIGTVINTLAFARDVGDGICIQVMQGNDTDSFGATAGSILGAFFGPGHLEERWWTPFRDDVHTALAMFHERSLDAIAARMAALPARLADDRSG